MNRRISAFTLIELTVVMLISGFLFGIAYLSLQLFQSRYRDFSHSSNKLIEIGRAKSLLSSDFAQAKFVIADQESIAFEKDSIKITYQFLPEHIIRQQQLAITDTFYLESQDRRFYLLGQELFDSEVLIDELSFKSTYHDEIFFFHFRKQYDASVLVGEDMKQQMP